MIILHPISSESIRLHLHWPRFLTDNKRVSQWANDHAKDLQVAGNLVILFLLLVLGAIFYTQFTRLGQRLLPSPSPTEQQIKHNF